MKQALAILVVIGFVVALSSAATYTPVKDAYLRYDGGDATPYVNPAYYGQGVYTYGGQASGRAGKPWNQDRMIQDFDREAIKAELRATVNGGGVDDATVINELINGTGTVVTLRLMSVGGTGFNHAAAYFPAYLTSTTAWTGESHASFAYADGTDAVNPIDLNVTTPWNGLVNQSALGMLPRNGNVPGSPTLANGTVRDCPWYWAAGSAQVWSAVDETYQTFTFPGAIIAGYLYSPLNAYIVMSNDNADNNGAAYSKEGLVFGSYAGPVLTVTVIPEPMTLSLLAAGALALIRRRK